MRRLMIMVALVALMVGLFATAAYAVNVINCTTIPCFGTDNIDIMYERSGNGTSDEIFGKARGDDINAYEYTDDVDILHGGRGPDELDAWDGDGLDTVYGGKGDDVCYIDPGDDAFGCELVNPF